MVIRNRVEWGGSARSGAMIRRRAGGPQQSQRLAENGGRKTFRRVPYPPVAAPTAATTTTISALSSNSSSASSSSSINSFSLHCCATCSDLSAVVPTWTGCFFFVSNNKKIQGVNAKLFALVVTACGLLVILIVFFYLKQWGDRVSENTRLSHRTFFDSVYSCVSAVASADSDASCHDLGARLNLETGSLDLRSCGVSSAEDLQKMLTESEESKKNGERGQKDNTRRSLFLRDVVSVDLSHNCFERLDRELGKILLVFFPRLKHLAVNHNGLPLLDIVSFLVNPTNSSSPLLPLDVLSVKDSWISSIGEGVLPPSLKELYLRFVLTIDYAIPFCGPRKSIALGIHLVIYYPRHLRRLHAHFFSSQGQRSEDTPPRCGSMHVDDGPRPSE